MEIGPGPGFPHPTFRENFPTWKRLFTEPLSILYRDIPTGKIFRTGVSWLTGYIVWLGWAYLTKAVRKRKPQRRGVNFDPHAV